MLDNIILCDLKKEAQSRVDSDMHSSILTNDCENDYCAQTEKLLEDVSSKMAAIRTAVPDDAYPTVFEGAKWKIVIKRCMRKLTWWFINRIVVLQHWRNEMLAASVEELCESTRLLKLATAELTNNVQKQFEQQKLSKSSDIENYIDYMKFEDAFRGSEDEIKNRLRRYLQYIEPGQKILDLGCGRGEWLETLKEFGACAVGVDMNPRCVEICMGKQLSVVEADMFSYLESVGDESLDAITSIQVIEHITPSQLARLISICYRKLRVGGVLLLETQNPAVLYTMAYNFYVDPTHIRPVHPIWLEYLIKENGFCNVITDYPDYSVRWECAQPHFLVNEDQEGSNHRVDFLNNMLFGPTDFACIAKKQKVE